MTVVVDASSVVAAAIDTGRVGVWADALLADHDLVAPHLLPVEVAHTLRRAVLANDLADEAASVAYAEVQKLRVELFAYGPLGSRAWELRRNVTMYDAWYVALAESIGVPLVTLDRRLARAAGPRCEFLTPAG